MTIRDYFYFIRYAPRGCLTAMRHQSCVQLRLLAFAPLLGAISFLACNKDAARGKSVGCFDATGAATSQGSRAVFAERHCQGGGVTWAGVLGTLLRRHGHVEPVPQPPPGWTGNVGTLNRRALVSVDDEGGSARLCADDSELLGTLRSDYERVNADVRLLREAMNEASSLNLECWEADGGIPELPSMFPAPVLPEAELRATQLRIQLLKETLRKQPLWCFPGDGAFADQAGALRFMADDRVVYTPLHGGPTQSMAVRWPREGNEDSRIEIDGLSVLSVLHLDVGDTGRLGDTGVERGGAIVREDLIPGDGCLK
jgi:hypothetical protein